MRSGASGSKDYFRLSGGSIMPVFDALYDHRKELNHILVRHEQGANPCGTRLCTCIRRGWRLSGYQWTGATNTITGIADAMIDSTPIVVIAGQVGTNFLGTDAFQEVDLVGITQPIHEMELPDSSCRRCGLGSGTCFLCGKERTSGTGRAGFC